METNGRAKENVIGIIGGSGLEHITDFLKDCKVHENIETAFGRPSGAIHTGTFEGVKIALLSRHGPKHLYGPNNLPYRANILALKSLGVTHLIAATACGSLREDAKPGDFMILDQFIDHTTRRDQTFYDGTSEKFKGTCHISMGKHPFNPDVRQALIAACAEKKVHHHTTGTMITIEGPRFSSLAESELYRKWGADVINMTTVPEVVLAKEAGIAYGAVALVTDYDCWHSHEVNVPEVLAVMKDNAQTFLELIEEAIPRMAKLDKIPTPDEIGAIL
eukprot:Platyproteum_vivax@DN10636_c0_g1_i1.p1